MATNWPSNASRIFSSRKLYASIMDEHKILRILYSMHFFYFFCSPPITVDKITILVDRVCRMAANLCLNFSHAVGTAWWRHLLLCQRSKAIYHLSNQFVSSFEAAQPLKLLQSLPKKTLFTLISAYCAVVKVLSSFPHRCSLWLHSLLLSAVRLLSVTWSNPLSVFMWPSCVTFFFL